MIKDAVSSSTSDVRQDLCDMSQMHQEKLEEVSETLRAELKSADLSTKRQSSNQSSHGVNLGSHRSSEQCAAKHDSELVALLKATKQKLEAAPMSTPMSPHQSHPNMVDSPYSSRNSSATSSYSQGPGSKRKVLPFYSNTHWEHLLCLEPSSPEALRCFMMAISLEKYTYGLESEEINLPVLGHLSQEELQDFGVHSAGARLRIQQAIQAYQKDRRAREA